ncbi:MAG: LytR/AlgR family response regulator transcription factor [Candidatus Aminicenantaceae bacterium]
MRKKRILIVDDEPLARESLRMALSTFEEIEVVGECSNGFEAVKSVKEKKPDIVFLDIQMPKLNGFDVLELLEEDPPYIVFVTAYDEYALKAFETHALDYLLKPVSPERLAKTMEKIKKRFNRKTVQPVEKLLSEYQWNNKPVQRILIKDRSDIFIIQTQDIIYMEAQEDYVHIHTKNSSYLKNDTLSNLEKRLDPQFFYRIHRSYILNINYLSKIEPYSKDSKIAVLKNGKTLPVSRSGYNRILPWLT